MNARDYSETLFLPKTDFPMRAGLPQKEPQLLARWHQLGLYERLRAAAAGLPKFILHDGPPYANGNIHIGHALNKILKDVVTRSQQMLGFDSNYVPGWDCHGLPIEWKIEEEYRAKGKNKDAVPLVEFRRECRAFAAHWVEVQREEFKRLGVEGDWAHPYSTMDFAAEAQIAREIMKFAQNGTLYRGSKPVMWSVVEKTALAEAEVEYEDYVSDQVWVKFPVRTSPGPNHKLAGAALVIWTTTPWTIPGNRAISYSPKIEYGLYEVVDAPAGNWAKPGERLVLADKLAADVFQQARVTAHNRLGDVPAADLAAMVGDHPLKTFNAGYHFAVPLLAGDHVTDDAGTGFVHTAPGHGREDFEVWTGNAAKLAARGINTTIPYTVDADGRFTDHAPGFIGKRVLTDKGDKGDANEAVIKALVDAGMLLARGRLKHQYPHSWRSKKPVIFRNTPQWFIAMDKPIAESERQGEAGRHAAPSRVRSDRDHPLGAAAGTEPHHRHGRKQARLGDLAATRLGRADHGIRPREGRRLGRDPQRRARQQAHRRRLRAGRRRRLVCDRRRRAFPQARLRLERVAEGRRHSRRLVRFRLDACIRAGRPRAFPLARRDQAQAGRRRRHRDVSRRVGPAPRLVPVLLARILRHARTRAVRRRAHARLRARRGRTQDVEVARQRDGAAGRDQAIGRRYPADVGVRVRLCRRSAHRAGNPQDHGGHLSQAAQHHPLDAGLACAFPRGRPHRAG